MTEKKNILIRKSEWVLILPVLLLLVFLPSVSLPELINPTQTGKFIIFIYGIIFISTICVIKIAINHSSFAVWTNICDILVAILVLYIIINRYGMAEHTGFSMRFFELVGLAALYIVVRNIPASSSGYLLLAMVASGIIQAVYGNLQLWGYYLSHHSGFRMTGSFFNPGPYAGFLASVFPIALGLYLFRGPLPRWQSGVFRVESLPGFRSIRLFQVVSAGFSTTIWNNVKQYETRIAESLKKYLAVGVPLAGIVAMLLVIPASRSRAAWLAVLVSSLFLMALRYDLKGWILKVLNTTFRKSIVIVLILCTLALSIIGLYLLKKDSADGRLLIWRATSQIIEDNLAFGVGFDRFRAHYMNEQAHYFKNNPDSPYVMTSGDVNYAFNEPIQFLAEEGIVGLLIVLALAYFLLTQINLHDPWQVICIAGLLSISTFSLFSYPSAILSIKVNFVIMLAFIVNQFLNKHTFRLILFYRKSHVSAVFRMVIVSTMMVAVYMGYGKANELKRGYEVWNNAFDAYQIGAYQASTREYQKALPLLKKDGEFLQHHGKALSMEGKYEEAVEVLEEAQRHLSTTVIFTALGDSYKALGKYEQAEKAYYQAWYMVPSRFYPKYLLAKLYDETANYDAARKTAQELLEKEVKINSTAIREIRTEMEKLLEKYSTMSAS